MDAQLFNKVLLLTNPKLLAHFLIHICLQMHEIATIFYSEKYNSTVFSMLKMFLKTLN